MRCWPLSDIKTRRLKSLISAQGDPQEEDRFTICTCEVDKNVMHVYYTITIFVECQAFRVYEWHPT